MLKESSPGAIQLRDYQVPPFLIDHTDLRFDLREKGSRVQARLKIRRNPAHPSRTSQLVLDGEGLRLHAIAIDDTPLAAERYQQTDSQLTVRDVPDQFLLSTEVEIAPEDNTALEGLYRSSGMFCTQCEAEGFRKITWYLDRPDVMSSFHVRLEADAVAFPVLLSNGNPQSAGALPDGRHFAEWDDPFPKPSYLFALVAGDLVHIEDQFTTSSGRRVDLGIYVERENVEKCDHAMQSLKHAMAWDEQQYGREYDLDVFNIVAVNDFNMGAMENKGLNIFNSKYVLASAETATDRDFQGIEGVIAHEYFHNWTGNRITCRDWFQLSLKEGFTVYRDQEFSADMGSRGVKRIEDVRLLRAHQFAEDASPMAHPVRPASYIEINNFYTVTVYEKGAEVVRMQARLLGDERFRKATDLYFARHDGQAVTTEDFVACMEDASGRDMTQFKHWYDYAGTPVLKVGGSYDAAAGIYTLDVEQMVPATPGQPEKPPFHIPFAVGLVGEDGADIEASHEGVTATTHMLELREHTQRFTFHGVTSRPVPSLLRGFSAPVKVEFDYRDEDLVHLMANDSDGFNRWDAAQTLMRQSLLQMVTDRQAGDGFTVDDQLLAAFRATLLDEALEPALAAEVLTMPGIGYLGDFMATIEIPGLFLAREQLRRTIAEQLREDLFNCYEQMHDSSPYQATPEAIGRRQLKNCALGYLMALQHDDARQLCVNQYGAQHNMTDVMAALALLADSDHPAREEVLADFAARWQNEALVMDKWFSVQAMSTRDDTLVRVTELMQHPAFSIRNPNKVRALIGAFAGSNPLRFHQADGSGYTFLADRVLELDPLNPQIAARLLRVMSRWQRYDEQRQAGMRDALERIVAAGVSKDVYEVAYKSLHS